jgi:hypothetical protein
MPLPSERLDASAQNTSAGLPSFDPATGETGIGLLTSALPAYADEFGGVSSNMLKANWVLGVAASGKDTAVELSAGAYASYNGDDALASQHISAAGGEVAEGAGGFAGAWAGAVAGAAAGSSFGPYVAVPLAGIGGVAGGIAGKGAVDWLLEARIETGGEPITTMDRPGLEGVNELLAQDSDLTLDEARAEILQQRAESAGRELFATPREAYDGGPGWPDPGVPEAGGEAPGGNAGASSPAPDLTIRDPEEFALMSPGQRVSVLMSAGYSEADARSAAADMNTSTNPIDNYGRNDTLDGSGTDWSADDSAGGSPMNPETNWGVKNDALDGDGTVWVPDQAGDTGPMTPEANWGADNDALNGNDTDWSPDDGTGGHATNPADNWGEENEALDGLGSEWPEEENADQAGGSEIGTAATSAAFGALGQALATESGVKGGGEKAAVSTVIGTLGQNLGQEIGSGTGFEDFGSDLAANTASTATGLVAGEVTADLAESLGFDGDSFGDQLGQRMTQYTASSAIEAGVNVATSGDVGSSFGDSFSGVGNVIGGFIGSYLGNEVTEDLVAAEMSAVHSSVGGDAFTKRALYQQIEAGETGPAALVEALAVHQQEGRLVTNIPDMRTAANDDRVQARIRVPG